MISPARVSLNGWTIAGSRVTYHSTMLDNTTLIYAARKVRENAYAPYSNFLGGVAIEDETGALHIGCNVENAAFPNRVCAEAGAIGDGLSSLHTLRGMPSAHRRDRNARHANYPLRQRWQI